MASDYSWWQKALILLFAGGSIAVYVALPVGVVVGVFAWLWGAC